MTSNSMDGRVELYIVCRKFANHSSISSEPGKDDNQLLFVRLRWQKSCRANAQISNPDKKRLSLISFAYICEYQSEQIDIFQLSPLQIKRMISKEKFANLVTFS